jgi:hypothetical protein
MLLFAKDGIAIARVLVPVLERAVRLFYKFEVNKSWVRGDGRSSHVSVGSITLSAVCRPAGN